LTADDRPGILAGADFRHPSPRPEASNDAAIGAAIAMVIAALSYFLSTVKGGKG